MAHGALPLNCLDGHAFQVDFEQYHWETYAMPTYKAARDPNRCPSHPGVALADILEDFTTPKAEIAQGLGISRQHLHDLLAGRKPLAGQFREQM